MELDARRIAELVTNPSMTVLDVGGGSGTDAVPLARAGCVVTVVDSSTDALAILRRRANDAGVGARVTGVQCDVDALSSRLGETFDLVLCHNVLEYVDDRPGALTELAGAVRPGGRLSLVVAGRLAAGLSLAQIGRFADARAVLHGPTGTFGSADTVRARFDIPGLTDLVGATGLRIEQVTGLGVVSGLVPGSILRAWNPHELAGIDGELGVHPVLSALGVDLHLLAHRPA